MTPQLRFPQFTDEWQVKKLGSFSKTFSGGTPTSTNPSFYNGNIPFIKSGEIAKNKTSQNISEEALKKSSAKMVESGDILYALYGATSGQVAISQMNGAINQAILCIRPDANRYFIYSKLAADKNTILETYLQGGQGNLSADIIKKLAIATPSKPEQEKIADFLTAVDERIAVGEKKLELLETYKRGVMQKIFSQQFRFKDENGEDYPEWEEKQLGSLVEIKKGTQLNGDTLTKDGNYPMLNGGMSPSGFTDSYNSDANTVTISEGGNSCGHVSYMSEKFWSGGHLYTFVDLKIDDKFVYQLLKFKQDEIMRLRVGSGLPNIQKGDLAKLRLYIPKLNEQQKIATFLTTLDGKITAEKSKLTAAKKWKKGLLQRMFV